MSFGDRSGPLVVERAEVALRIEVRGSRVSDLRHNGAIYLLNGISPSYAAVSVRHCRTVTRSLEVANVPSGDSEEGNHSSPLWCISGVARPGLCWNSMRQK